MDPAERSTTGMMALLFVTAGEGTTAAKRWGYTAEPNVWLCLLLHSHAWLDHNLLSLACAAS